MTTEPSNENLEPVLEDLSRRAEEIREEATDPTLDCEGPTEGATSAENSVFESV
jgi:hypothetical protein